MMPLFPQQAVNIIQTGFGNGLKFVIIAFKLIILPQLDQGDQIKFSLFYIIYPLSL